MVAEELFAIQVLVDGAIPQKKFQIVEHMVVTDGNPTFINLIRPCDACSAVGCMLVLKNVPQPSAKG